LWKHYANEGAAPSSSNKYCLRLFAVLSFSKSTPEKLVSSEIKMERKELPDTCANYGRICPAVVNKMLPSLVVNMHQNLTSGKSSAKMITSHLLILTKDEKEGKETERGSLKV